MTLTNLTRKGNMTKEKIKNILDKLDFWMNEDKKLQNALGVWMKAMAPSSYVPIIETSLVQSFLSAISSATPDLKDDLEYYAYELSGMEKSEGLRNGKKYDLKNREEYIDFILSDQ